MGHKHSTTEYLNFFDNLGDYSNTYKREYWTPENKSNSYARLKSTRPSNINPRNGAVWAFDKEWDYWDPETKGLLPRTFTFGASITF